MSLFGEGGPQEQQRITSEHANAKMEESKAAWRGVMDKMAESKQVQGDYFATFGESDKKVIIPRSGWFLNDQSSENFDPASARRIAITEDGIFLIRKNRIGDVDNGGEFHDFSNFDLDKSTVLYTTDNNLQAPLLEVTDSYGSPYRLGLEPTEDMDFVDKTIKKSIENTESPHKARFEASQKKINLAQDLGNRIAQLPPRE